MDIDHQQYGLTYLLLERVDRGQNANRFYYLAWQPPLFAEGAVVRSYGRKDGLASDPHASPLLFT